MASSNQTPDVLFSPIAANADASDINTIPQTYDPSNYGYAAQNVGFPTECRLPVLNPDGTLGQGRAPRMQDWNGIMKLVSSHNFFLQNGGSYTFNPTVSSNIGGYPKNAVLWYFPENEAPCLVYSLINDNTNNFVDDPTLIDGSHWEMLVNPSSYANIALTNSPYTTNRILEIPQNIKLELNNGTLTLKAGSKVYVPNGFESDGVTPKFDVVTVGSDVTKATYGWAVQTLVFVNSSNTEIVDLYTDQCYSGAIAPTTSTNTAMIWYDTANNLIKVKNNGGSTWTTGSYSLPIGLVTSTTTTYASIDQVFNGMGYIGSTVFALPGVKTVVSDGRNEDGTCKNNAPSTITSVKTVTMNIAFTGYIFTNFASSVITVHDYVCSKTKPTVTNTTLWYNPETNLPSLVLSNGNITTPYGEIPIAKFTSDSTGKITSLEPYTVDSIANSNASNFTNAGRSYLSTLPAIGTRVSSWTVGASGSTYTASKTGWLVYEHTGLNFLLYIDNKKVEQSSYNSKAGTVYTVRSVYVEKGSTVTITYDGTLSSLTFYDAKGEE